MTEKHNLCKHRDFKNERLAVEMTCTLVISLVVLAITAASLKCQPSSSPWLKNVQLWNNIFNKTARELGLEKLLLQYSTICPLNKNCDIISNSTRSNWTYARFPHFPHCPDYPYCNCDFDCVWMKTCCPGSPYGYLHVDCINVAQYPLNRTISYVMIATCPESFAGSAQIREGCENNGTGGLITPVTSYATSITYKNKYCAICNADLGGNTGTWKLQAQCEKKQLNNDFQSFRQIKRMLTENRCLVAHYPPHGYRGFKCQMYAGKHHTDRVQIGQCNETGLWQKYDPDIDRACNTLELSYRNFKNIFCYICNPSVISSKPRDLIESCNVTGSWSQYDQDTEEACLSMSVSSRWYPFRNRYCALCNGLLQNKYYEVLVKHLSEDGISIFNALHTLSSGHNSKITMEIKFSSKHMTTLIRSFSKRICKNDTYKLKSNKTFTDSTNSNNKHNQLRLGAYFSVCGRHGCLQNTSSTSICVDEYGCQAAPNQVCGKCSCKSTCAELDACCLDTLLTDNPYSCMTPEELGSFGNQQIDILSETYYKRFIVIDKCLNKAYHEQDIVDKCERWMDYTPGEALLGIPVSTSGSHIPYRNIYCLMCNNYKANESVLSVGIKCDRYIDFHLLVNIDHLADIARENCRITFHVSSAPCNRSDVGMGLQHFRHSSPTSVELPASLQVLVDRHTIAQHIHSVITTCNTTGAWVHLDQGVREVCENDGEYMLRLKPYSINNITYVNFACFLCNPDPTMSTVTKESVVSSCNVTGMWTETDTQIRDNTEEMCYAFRFQSRWLPFKNVYCSVCNLGPLAKVYPSVEIHTDVKLSYQPTYQLLFSLNPDEWEKIQQASDTGHGQPECGLNDALHEACQESICAKNRHLVNGSCVPLINSISDVEYDVSIHLKIDMDASWAGPHNNIGVDLIPRLIGNCTDITCVQIDLREMCFKISYATAHKFPNETLYYVNTCDVSVDAPCADPGPTLIRMSEISHINISFSIYIRYTDDLMKTEDALKYVQSAVFVFSVNNTLTYAYKSASVSLKDDTLPAWMACRFKHIPPMLYGIGDEAPVTNQPRSIFNKLLTCVQVQLSDKYFTYYEDTDTVVLTNARNVTLHSGEFEIINSTLHVCKDDVIFDNVTISRTPSVSPVNHMAWAYGIVSTTCRTMSIVCLLITLITYCLFKSLRTMPGKNNMTLVIFLISAQLALQFGVPLPNTFSILCPLMGAVTHFVWLATFFAMNVCCFHMFRVFHWQALVSPNSSASVKQYVLYVLYVIASSTLVVICTVCGHLVASNGTFTGYGKYACFISERLTLILAFIVPSCLIFASNILFFSLAFHKIRTSPHMGAASSSSDRHDLVVYIKLCTLVGLTWPLQLVASNLPMSVFTFVVEGINALQGMFIFFAYVCQARVMALYQANFCKCSPRYKGGSTTESGTQKVILTNKLSRQETKPLTSTDV